MQNKSKKIVLGGILLIIVLLGYFLISNVLKNDTTIDDKSVLEVIKKDETGEFIDLIAEGKLNDDFTIEDNDVLHLAAIYNADGIANYLLENKFNRERINGENNTAFELTIIHSSKETFDLFINQKVINGSKYMYYALENKDRYYLEVLLGNGEEFDDDSLDLLRNDDSLLNEILGYLTVEDGQKLKEQLANEETEEKETDEVGTTDPTDSGSNSLVNNSNSSNPNSNNSNTGSNNSNSGNTDNGGTDSGNETDTKPTLIVPSFNEVALNTNYYPLSDVSVSDKEDGEIPTKNIEINNPVDTNVAGVYVVKFSVSDSDGNKVETTQTVLVNDGSYQVGNDYILQATNFNRRISEVIIVDNDIRESAFLKIYEKKTGNDVTTTQETIIESGGYTNVIGNYLITFTIKSDNSSSIKVTATVVNSNDPVLEVPSFSEISQGSTFDLTSNITVNDDYDELSATDIKVEAGSFDSTVAGVYLIKYHIEDSDGNIVTKNRTLLVNDGSYMAGDKYIIKAIDYSKRIVEVDTSDEAIIENSHVKVFDKNTAIDVTTAQNVIVNKGSYTNIVGEYPINFTVENDNTTKTKITITVVKSNDPILEVPTFSEINQNSTIDLTADITVSDDYDELSVTDVVIEPDSFDSAVAGVYLIKYTITDGDGNEVNKSRTILVNDGNYIAGNDYIIFAKNYSKMLGKLEVSKDAVITESGVKVFDKKTSLELSDTARPELNVDLGSLTKAVGVYDDVVILINSDVTAKKVITVTVEAGDVPTINIDTGNVDEDFFELYVNESFDPLSGVSANDTEDGNITSITVVGSVDTTKAGTYLLTYKVTDSDGNSAERKKVVLVNDGSYAVGKKYLMVANNFQKYEIEVVNGYQDILDSAGLKIIDKYSNEDITDSVTVSVDKGSYIGKEGKYIIWFSTTEDRLLDNSDILSQYAYATVITGDKPVINLEKAVEVIKSDTAYTPSINSVSDTEDDALGLDVNVTVNPETVDLSKIGVYPIEFTATDSHGYTVTAKQLIFVTDENHDVAIGENYGIISSNYSLASSNLDTSDLSAQIKSLSNTIVYDLNTQTEITSTIDLIIDEGTLSNVGGEYDVAISVTDEPTTKANIKVTVINNVINFTNSASLTNKAMENYEYLPVTDANSELETTFTITNKPNFLEFDSATGKLSGYPKYDDQGTYDNIIITAQNSEAIGNYSFTLEITKSFIELAMDSGDYTIIDSSDIQERISYISDKRSESCKVVGDYFYGDDYQSISMDGASGKWVTKLNSLDENHIPLLSSSTGETYTIAGEFENSKYIVTGILLFDSDMGNQLYNSTFSEDAVKYVTGNENFFTDNSLIYTFKSGNYDINEGNFIKGYLSKKGISHNLEFTNVMSDDVDLVFAFDLSQEVIIEAKSRGIPIIAEYNGNWGYDDGYEMFNVGLGSTGTTTINNFDSFDSQCNQVSNFVRMFDTLENNKLDLINADEACTDSVGKVSCSFSTLKNADGDTLSYLVTDEMYYLSSIINNHDNNGENVFEVGGEQAKLGLLLADMYREDIVYPMEHNVTDDNVFYRAFLADYLINYARSNNTAQSDLGDFGSDQSVIDTYTLENATVTLETADVYNDLITTGYYLKPGQELVIRRTDSSATTASIQLNTQRTGSSRAWDTDNGYSRPYLIRSNAITIDNGEELRISAPHGGNIYINISAAKDDTNLTFELENVLSYPVLSEFDETSINNYVSELETTPYKFTDIVTDYAAIHAVVDRMLGGFEEYGGDGVKYIEDINNYLINGNYSYAGYESEAIGELPTSVSSWFINLGLTDYNNPEIHTLPTIQHFNVDYNAHCGALCSGNPIDTQYILEPLDWGENHEMGHNLQTSRMNIYGNASGGDRSSESSNNIFPVNTARQSAVDAGKETYYLSVADDYVSIFAKLNTAYLSGTGASIDHWLWTNNGIYDQSTERIGAYLQIMFATQDYNVWAKMYITNRLINSYVKDETKWNNFKDELGFSEYNIAGIKAINANDYIYILASYYSDKDLSEFFIGLGIEISDTAKTQVAANGFSSSLSAGMYYLPFTSDNMVAVDMPTQFVAFEEGATYPQS